ncbi:hypothetical protein, partial [Bifidobacterium crudilactis]|uniref:hypothetical protein n=1 Tax=Bifidobacterium crudilactis TaxID=327277 RepID=UPI00235697C0
MGWLRGVVACRRHSEHSELDLNETGIREVRDDGRFPTWRGLFGLAVLIFAMFALMVGATMLMPVQKASADAHDYGPDGYFSRLSDGARPIVESSTQSNYTVTYGWLWTPTIKFGKEGNTGTYEGALVSGGYKTAAKGPINYVPDANAFDASTPYTNPHSVLVRSGNTTVTNNEALLWADDTVTMPVRFSTEAYNYAFDTFDGYQSNLAEVADRVDSDDDVAGMNYSTLEQYQMRVSPVEAVCTTPTCSGSSGIYVDQTTSAFSYRVFPLTTGDLRVLFNNGIGSDINKNLTCPPKDKCTNQSWLRNHRWQSTNYAHGFILYENGGALSQGYWDRPQHNEWMYYSLRPALRLKLDKLLLSAHSGDQSQTATIYDNSLPQGGNDPIFDTGHPDTVRLDSLRLTFVDESARLWLSKMPRVEQVGASWVLKDVEGVSTLKDASGSNVQSGLGWKLVDPE